MTSKEHHTFLLRRFGQSFGHAFRGWITFLRREQNARIHAVAATAVIVAGLLWRIQPWEWVAVVLSMAGVLAAEMLNSALEALCDHLHPDLHPAIRQVKDLAAGAVLVAAVAALVVGGLVFGPRLWHLLGVA